VAVQGNFIGTYVTGATAVGNSGNGIDVEGSSNTIGGTAAGDRNIISGNSSAFSSVSGVYIDTNASGMAVQDRSRATCRDTAGGAAVLLTLGPFGL
jgi:hypothetical protein